MLFLTHLLAVLGAPLLLLILWRATSSPNKPRGTTLPPELPGAWPIIGHLHLLRGETTLARTLAAMADAEGPMFRIQLGVHPTIVISSREAVRECLTTHDKNLASRVKSKAGIHLGYGNAAFAFTEYGDFWRQMRKITMLESLSTRRLDNLKHVQASEIDTFIKDLHSLCRTNTDNVQNGSSKVVVISQLLELLTLNIIIRMIASKRYFGLWSASTGSSTDDDEASHLRKVIKDMMYISGYPAISDLLPFAGWTDCVGTVKTMKRVARELDEIIGKWVEEHKLKRGDHQRGDAIDVQEDFIDVMLSVNFFWSKMLSVIGEDGLASFGHSPETLIKATVMHFEFNPFGSGRRSCPVASFALRVTHLTLARLLQGFDLATPSDEPVDMTEGLGITMPMATPLDVVLTPRLPSKLYEQLMQN